MVLGRYSLEYSKYMRQKMVDYYAHTKGICRICKIKILPDEADQCRLKNRNQWICKPCIRKQVNASMLKVKQDVVQHYGGKCECCGESKFEFMTIDHINGLGIHKRENGRSKVNMWRFLKRNNYPKDNYRLLCYNCNCSRGFLGYCPHEKITDGSQ